MVGHTQHACLVRQRYAMGVTGINSGQGRAGYTVSIPIKSIVELISQISTDH